jgi:serine/threonine protein kinase
VNDPLLNHQLGSYRLIEVLGKGSFAQVYRGQHIHLDTFAAIKVLHAQLGEQEKQDFQKEALLLTKLKHEHIIHFMDFGFISGRPYLITDLAERGSLHRIYPRGTRLPLASIIDYVAQIADGLDFAHTNKVIHRDIKPENILVGETGKLLLADFGIARLFDTSRAYLTNSMAGTLPYMSPEQFEGRHSPSSDQYALGVMVYEWLTGRFPFEGTAMEIFKQHVQDAPPLLRLFNPTISQEVESVVLTTLKKQPEQRFRTTQAFANALRQAAGNSSQPVRVDPPEPPLDNVAPHRTASAVLPPVKTPDTDPDQSSVRTPSGKSAGPSRPLPPADSGEWRKLLPAAQALSFTELPGLPQARLTDFWWPTFIIMQEERRKMNQGTIPSEVLSALGPLTSFPSLSVALPISSVPPPVSIGSLDSVQRISTGAPGFTPPSVSPGPGAPGVGRTVSGQAGGRTAQAAQGRLSPLPPAQPGLPRSGTGRTASPVTPGGRPPGTARSDSSGIVLAITIAILTLVISISCASSGSSGHSTGAIIASGLFVGISFVSSCIGLANIKPQHTGARGWLLFFLIVAVIIVFIDIALYQSVVNYCASSSC